MTDEPLIIVDGGWYQRGDGSVVQVHAHNNLPYAWRSSPVQSYTATGKYWFDDPEENEYDLMRRVYVSFDAPLAKLPEDIAEPKTPTEERKKELSEQDKIEALAREIVLLDRSCSVACAFAVSEEFYRIAKERRG